MYIPPKTSVFLPGAFMSCGCSGLTPKLSRCIRPIPQLIRAASRSKCKSSLADTNWTEIPSPDNSQRLYCFLYKQCERLNATILPSSAFAG